MEQAKKGTSRPSDLPQDATCYLAEKKETFERPIKSLNQAACWGLMPVILATQGTEIRRIEVQGQPRQKSSAYLEKK
jgi:hypothetical protein